MLKLLDTALWGKILSIYTFTIAHTTKPTNNLNVIDINFYIICQLIHFTMIFFILIGGHIYQTEQSYVCNVLD